MLWLAVALIVAHARTAAAAASANKTTKLVEKIRRQLMEDNYDYLPSETELITPSAHDNDPDAPNDDLSDHDNDDRLNDNRGDNIDDNNNDKHKTANRFFQQDNEGEEKVNYKYVNDNNKYNVMGKGYSRVNDKGDRNNLVNSNDGYTVDDKAKDEDGRYSSNNDEDNRNNDKIVVNTNGQSNYEDYFVRRAREDDTEPPPRPNHVVSKNDLLYYMDDEHLRMRRRGGGETGEREGAEGDVDDYEDDNATEATRSTVKYKVFKVKGSHGSRRSGGAARFIAEQSAAGVALASVDGAPLPPLRLRAARRQYMADTDSDDTVPPGAPDKHSQ